MNEIKVGDKVRDIKTGEIGTVVFIDNRVRFPIHVSFDLGVVPPDLDDETYYNDYYVYKELQAYMERDLKLLEEDK